MDPATPDLRATTAVAAYGLGEPRDILPPVALAPSAWRQLLGRVEAERLTGLLAAAIARGHFPASPDQAEEAFRYHAVQMTHCLRLERTLLEVAAIFDRSGIDHRVLKGPAVARLDYPDPTWRPYVDIDLLVPSGAYDDATRCLEKAGLARHFGEPRPGFDRRFGKGAAFDTPEGLQVDLHRTFVFGPFGLTVDLDDAWKEPAPFYLDDHLLHGLSQEVRLLHACLHAVLGDYPPRLLALRDVAQLAAGCADQTRLQELSERWRIGAVVKRARELAAPLTAAPASSALSWAAHVRPSRLEARMLEMCTDPSASYGTKTLMCLAVLPGTSARIAFIRALAFPDRAYVGSRHSGRATRWQAAGREVRGLLRQAVRR